MKCKGNSPTALLLLLYLAIAADCKDQYCPYGQYTKDVPSPESNLHSCKQFSCNSCCTEEITKELAKVPLQEVGGLNYTQCGVLSDMCSQFISYTQCFYQCSPNVYPWVDEAKRRMNNLPICSEFCDNWYAACKYDRTCVVGTDWSRGFKLVTDPDRDIETLQCQDGSICRNFSEVYPDGKAMCNQMWAGSLAYTEGTACVNPADMQHNSDFIHETLGEDYQTTVCENGSYTDVGMIIGIVIGVIAGVVLIGALVYVITTKRKQKVDKKSTPKELEELDPAKKQRSMGTENSE